MRAHLPTQVLLVAALGLAVVAFPGAVGATKTMRYLEPSAVDSAALDAEMAAAERHAKETFDQFVRRLRAKSEADLEFAVRLRLRDADGRQEALWLVDVREQRGGAFGAGNLVGVVDTQPRRLHDVWVGKTLRIAAADVSDWLIVVRTLHGERRIGGFTQQVLEARERRGIVSDVLAVTAPSM